MLSVEFFMSSVGPQPLSLEHRALLIKNTLFSEENEGEHCGCAEQLLCVSDWNCQVKKMGQKLEE